MTVEFHSGALAEFIEAIDYFNERSPNLGFSFSDEVKDAIDRVRQMPYAWPEIDKENSIRRCLTHRFPYAVIYQVRPDRILILAVAHLRRRENYWHGRVNDN